jgi:hypothetical protein
MTDSVLDRIRQNRNRAAVPPRNDSLITHPSALADQPAPQAPDPAESASQQQPPPAPTRTLEDLKAELATIPETHRHSAIVLDKALDQDLTRYCKDQRITVEVFLEAAWVQATADPTLMQAILAEAKRRYANRKQAGKLRRLITMLEGEQPSAIPGR